MFFVEYILLIEKCSSPIGDGNISRSRIMREFTKIEKCSSPIGDGNSHYTLNVCHCLVPIEKCSSPIGDGNSYPNLETVTFGNKVNYY